MRQAAWQRRVECCERPAHARRRIAQVRRTRLQHMPAARILDAHDIAIQARLFIAIDVTEWRGDLRGNIVLPEVFNPVLRSARGDDRLVCAEVRRDMAGRIFRIFGGNGRRPHGRQRLCHPRRLVGRIMHMDPAAVGAHVQGNRRVLVQALGEDRRGLFSARPMHAHRRQRRLRKTRARHTAAPVTYPGNQARHHADNAKPARHPARKRHAHEHGSVPMAGLLIEHAQPRQHERLARRRVRQRMGLRPGRDGANDQLRTRPGQRRIVESARRRLSGREVVQQNIRACQQLLQCRATGGTVDIEREPLLAAIEYGKQHLLLLRIAAGRLDAHHVRARFRQLQARGRPGDVAREFNDAHRLQDSVGRLHGSRRICHAGSS